MLHSEKEKQLSEYLVSDFFTIQPTIKTGRNLQGHQLVHQLSDSELAVWAKVSETDETEPFISLNNDLSLSFLLKLNDNNFLNYTNLKLENANKIYYFSNKKPTTESVSFSIINLNGDSQFINENYILSETGANNELEMLSDIEKRNLFGIIKIYMKGDISTQDVTDVQGKITNPHKTYELLFENRKTTWRYFFDTDQKVKNPDDVEEENGNKKVLVTKKEQPLTQKGFVSIELGKVELPNPNSTFIKPNSTNNIIFSEIYL